MIASLSNTFPVVNTQLLPTKLQIAVMEVSFKYVSCVVNLGENYPRLRYIYRPWQMRDI